MRLTAYIYFVCVIFSINHLQANEELLNLQKHLFQTNVKIFQATFKDLKNKQINNTYWDFGSYLGPSFISTFFLISEAANLKPIFNEAHKLQHQQILNSTQLEDGSWQTVEDLNVTKGDLNATIWNYLYLANFTDFDSIRLAKAKKFILANGGVEDSSLFTKFHLAALGLYPYSKLPNIPKSIVTHDSEFDSYKKVYFAQWVGPHLSAMYALRKNEIVFNLHIKEHISDFKLVQNKTKRKVSEKFIIKNILRTQKQNGSWGGYTVSTTLNILVLISEGYEHENIQISKGLDFIKSRYFEHEKVKLLGSLQDGRYWDTILLTQGLNSMGFSFSLANETLDYLLSIQVSNGGIPFGLDFEYAPDIDDTAEWILALLPFIENSNYKLSDEKKTQVAESLYRAVDFILSMQNKDGGWGAFSLNNKGNFLLKLLTRQLTDSVDLFDDSSVDVTAHAIEALAKMKKLDSNTFNKSLKYFSKLQNQNGSWQARWGINYIYATSAVLVALSEASKVLPSFSSEIARISNKAVSWMMQQQNVDGGFGESSESYNNPQLAGKGLSTPTQTALALLALVNYKDIQSSELNNAVSFLHNNFLKNQTWKDDSAVGTGHPGVLYMQYNSYAWAFSTIALGKYQQLLQIEIDKNL